MGAILLVLLGLSAIVSGSEVAFFSLNSHQINNFKASDLPSEKRVFSLINRPKLLLATILICNNFINVAIITLSTFVAWEIMGTTELNEATLLILTGITTIALLLFGELAPKLYANQNNESFVKTSSGLLMFARRLFKPLSFVLMNFTKVIETRAQKRGIQVSVDDLNQALEMATQEGTTEEEKDILKGIVNFGQLSVTQVMRARLDVTAFDFEMDFHELMDRINKTGYSRVPVYRETIDKIEGILYIKDILPYVEEEEVFEWQKLLREAYYVPESKKIGSLLREFQEMRVHMAIVVDEYGGTSGIITMEDIIEEIVGEINDEYDDEDIAYNKLDDNTYVFEGKVSLNDFTKILDLEPSTFDEVKGESESLAGLILELNSKLPRSGEKINHDRFVFTVVAADSRRIKRVRVLIK